LGEIFTERKGGGSGRRIGSSASTIFLERGDEEKRKKKRERRSPSRTDIGDSCALPCLKGASVGDTLRAYVTRFPLPAGSLGHHYPWLPTIYLGHHVG
jgi:hypothetical protein